MDRSVREAIKYLKTLDMEERLLLLFEPKEFNEIAMAALRIQRVAAMSPDEVALVERMKALREESQ